MDKKTTQKPCFTLEILSSIKDAQLKHGLRHGDYQRYQGYCSRRLRRIRKSLQAPVAHRNRFLHRKLKPSNVTDVRHLHIPLMSAERSWSFSVLLKEEANTDRRKRFQMNSRLRKAVQYATDLESLCENDFCDAKTKLEAKAYASWMRGTLNFEQQQWDEAIKNFSDTSMIYVELCKAVTEEQQVLYKQRVEEITASIRYSAYNIGDETAIEDLMKMRSQGGQDILMNKIDNLISQTREKQSRTLSEVTWRGRTVAVRNETVRLFLLSALETEKQISAAHNTDSKISLYENLLLQCKDALQLLSDELKNDPKSRAQKQLQQETGSVKLTALQYLHCYVSYTKQIKTIQRNILMAKSYEHRLHEGDVTTDGKKLSKPQDLIRIYDIILQNLGELLTVPGTEEDEDASFEIRCRQKGFRAFRCYYLALSYLSVKKWREAYVLFERVLQHTTDAVTSYKRLTYNPYKDEVYHLEELIDNVKAQKYSAYASSVLDIDGVSDKVSQISLTGNNKKLMDRLEDYDINTKISLKKPDLVQFPPEFQPIPCKPLFFDLASNYIEFPSLEDRIEQKRGEGITGLVKSWLWGGGGGAEN